MSGIGTKENHIRFRYGNISKGETRKRMKKRTSIEGISIYCKAIIIIFVIPTHTAHNFVFPQGQKNSAILYHQNRTSSASFVLRTFPPNRENTSHASDILIRYLNGTTQPRVLAQTAEKTGPQEIFIVESAFCFLRRWVATR